jgi:hypothetical protein
MIGVELEALAKKFDRFGWERDMGSAVHTRLVEDWMDALQDYPLSEVKAACREAVKSNPNKMPNEGHVIAEIMKARQRTAAENIARLPRQEPIIERPDEEAKRRAAEIVAKAFPGIGAKWAEYKQHVAKE